MILDQGKLGVTRPGYHYIGGRFCDGPDIDDSSTFMQYTLDSAIDQCNIDDTCGCIGHDKQYFLHKKHFYLSVQCSSKSSYH